MIERKRGDAWGPLLATAAACADFLVSVPPVLAPAALALLLVRFRRSWRPLALLALAAVLTDGAWRVQAHWLAERWPEWSESQLAAAVSAVKDRSDALVSAASSAAEAAAELPESRLALAGNQTLRARLFSRLDGLRQRLDRRPALGVHTENLATVAWAGPVGDPAALRGFTDRSRVFVTTGSVTATLVAVAPVTAATRPLGFATAEIPLAVRRHIRNEYLSDFDLLSDPAGSAEVSYQDVRDAGFPSFPPLPKGVPYREVRLEAPDGQPLAVVRVRAPRPFERLRALAVRWSWAETCLAGLVLALWALAAPFGRVRLTIGATALRLLLLLLGTPFLGPGSTLISPEVYASTVLGPLVRSPLDLLLTALWLLALAILWGVPVLRRAPRSETHPALALLLDIAALVPIVSVFAWIGDTVTNCSLDLETIGLVPRSLSHLTLHLALLALLAAAALVSTLIVSLAGPFPASRTRRILRLAGWAAIALAIVRASPQDLVALPRAPALVLFLATLGLGSTRNRWLAWCHRLDPGQLAGIVLAALMALATVLCPSLIHYAERNTRIQIESDHAPLVLRQPAWREYVLAETRRRIDALSLLEDAPAAPHLQGAAEMAFGVWSTTDLANFGFSSALEIQDATGLVISRFALNLPTLSGPRQDLPTESDWVVTQEPLRLGSQVRPVLHARKRLVYHGEVHGAVHVYVADDYWNLPFLTGRDPYSVLFRSAPPVRSPARQVGLVVYSRERQVVFSTSERPPALESDLVSRLGAARAGLWTTLPFDGRPHHVFLFADAGNVYGLHYPRLGAARFAADLVEAASGIGALGAALLLLVMLVRTALGRGSLSLTSLARAVAQSFSLRLFLSFLVLALVPVGVLQFLVRGFVARHLEAETRSQALERAGIAKKAVEDFVYFQKGETPAGAPVTDAALVWIARLIRSDLDVFHGGRLRASSKRELYASGLLPSRVPGEVYRGILLEGEPSLLRTETIGGFSYLVASVPVNVDGTTPGILSVPMAPRQREVEMVLQDLDRNIWLASVLFLMAAAALGHSMARRLVRPIRDLTRATGRIADGDLETRVSPTSRDELRDLVESFNRMAADLRRQRRDIERSNRLAAWAEMARQVAHEIKNPLTPIQLSAEHLRRVFHDPGVDFGRTLASCTETILKQVRILRGIVTEFSAFARPPAEEPELQDLGEVVEELLKPYQLALPPGVRLRFDRDGPSARVRGDRRLLERAVVNLVENALQAVGEDGEIAVRVGARGARVEVEVSDTGPGVEPEVAARVFEPFFSTKTSGSGLGLALVKKIAEDHSGGVSLEGGLGTPTRAVLWVPAAEDGEVSG